MGEKYMVSTLVLSSLDDKTPGQIGFDRGIDGMQQVELETWQYDILITYLEEIMYGTELSGLSNGERGALLHASRGTHKRLLRAGKPFDVEARRTHISARSEPLQPYPKFDGTQNCASVGVGIMYSSERGEASITVRDKIANVVCDGCPFITECLTWALHHEEYGVWGGMTATERKRARKENGIKLVDPYVTATYGETLRY